MDKPLITSLKPMLAAVSFSGQGLIVIQFNSSNRCNAYDHVDRYFIAIFLWYIPQTKERERAEVILNSSYTKK